MQKAHTVAMVTGLTLPWGLRMGTGLGWEDAQELIRGRERATGEGQQREGRRGHGGQRAH